MSGEKKVVVTTDEATKEELAQLLGKSNNGRQCLAMST